MPTINQLFNNTRMKQPNKTRAPDLKKHPFKKVLCLKIFIRKPKKPNSALRKIARVKRSTKKEVTADIPVKELLIIVGWLEENLLLWFFFVMAFFFFVC
jgi:ribosomal protein S12